MFGSQKVLKKKNVKKDDFLLFPFIVENGKESEI